MSENLSIWLKVLNDFGLPIFLLMASLFAIYKITKKTVSFWIERFEKHEIMQEEFRDYLMQTAKEQITVIQKNTEINEKTIKVWEELIEVLKNNKMRCS